MDEGKLFPKHKGNPSGQDGPKDQPMGEVYGVIHLPFLPSYCVLCNSHKPPPKFSTLQRSESLDEGTGAGVDGEADHELPSAILATCFLLAP